MPKITALNEAPSIQETDILPIVDESASSTKRITLAALKGWLQSLTGWITAGMIANNQLDQSKSTDTGWLLPSFQSGWSNNGGAIVAYRMIAGTVYLRGQVTKSGGLVNGTIFYLPEGMRPAVQRIWTCPGSSLNYGKIVIDPDGGVGLAAVPAGGSYIGLDAIAYPIN